MVAGQLQIDLVANVARLITDMQQAQRTVGSAMQNISGAVSKATAELGTLGVGLSVGALVFFADRTLNAIAKMKDLGEVAGTTASAMSKFEEPTRKAGSSLDIVATAMFRLSKAALESKDPASASAQALAAIGISTAQIKGLKPDEMFELIARSMAKYGDGLEKNAVMQQLLGKSGKEMNGVMKQIADQATLTATVTDEQAAAAKLLEEQIVQLKMTGEAFWRSLISEAVPALNEALKSFMENRKELGLLQAAFDAVLNMGKGGSSLEAQLKAINDQIALARRASDIQAGGGGLFDFNSTANNAVAAKLNDLLIQRANIEHLIFAQELEAQNRRATSTLKPTPAFDPAALAAAKAAEDAYKGLNAQLDREIANLRGVGEMEAFVTKLQQEKYAKIKPEERDELIRKEAIIVKLKQEAAARSLLLESDIALMEVMQKLHDLDVDYAASARDQVDQMQFEITLIGKTAEEVSKLTALRQADLDLRKLAAQIPSEDGMSAAGAAALDNILKTNDALKGQIGILHDVGDAAKNSVSLWTQFGDKVGQVFADLIVNGGSAIDKLRAMFKSLLADMINIFVRQWILNLAAGGTVMGAAGGALATTTGGSAGGSVLGSALGSAASSVGASAVGTAFWGAAGMGAGGVPAAAGMGAAAAADSIAINAAAGTYGAALSGVYTALAAIPVWGWIAMAVIAIGAWIAGNHKGGPKTGGSFMGDYDAQGNFIGSSAVPGSDNGRFFTPDQMDTQMRALVDATAKGYAGTLAALGGRGGGFSFGLGADNDPQGTAQSRVSSMLRDRAGNIIYRSQDVSMDDKAVPAALQLESSRMILAALKASELPAYLQHVFDGLTPSSATQDQIDTAIKQALALKDIFDIVTRNPMEDVAQSLTDALNPLQTALHHNETTIRGVMSAFDGSAAATDSLRAATVGYYNAQVQLLVGIQNTKSAIDDMFGATFRNIRMAGMDSQGRYNFLQSEAAQLQTQALASTDPETIRALSQRINDDIAAAFNMLSPEEQAAQSQSFLARGQATQEAIDARLEAILKDAKDATQKTLDDIKEIIGANADKEKAAAAKQDEAADKNLAAAVTPKVIVLQLPSGQQVGAFSGG